MIKTVLLTITISVIVLSCTHTNSQSIGFNGIDKFKLGQNIDSLISVVKMGSEFDYEISDSVCTVRERNSRNLFTLTYSNRIVECIGVFSDKYELNGIKIGSKVADIKQRYPDMRIKYIHDLEYECVELQNDLKLGKIQIVLNKMDDLIGQYKSISEPTSNFNLKGQVEGFLILR
jgi:hypothetical protein